MEKELIKAVENWSSKNCTVIPFNIELMQLNQIPLDQNESYGVPKDGFPEVDILQNLGHASFIPQFMYKLDKVAIDIINNINPTLVVWMGEDSNAQNFGYPKSGPELYNYQSIHNDPRPRGNMKFYNIINSNNEVVGLFIENYGPCDNCSIGLFPTRYWKIARLFGTEFGFGHSVVTKTKFISEYRDLLNRLGFDINKDYINEYKIYKTIFRQYVKEVLNLEFSDDY